VKLEISDLDASLISAFLDHCEDQRGNSIRTRNALGLYGLLAFVVGRREHEIGIRMALGADQRAIVRLVLTQVCLFGLLGVAVGIAAAMVASRALQSVLFQTNAFNPLVLLVTIVVLFTVVGAASYLPIHRAVHVDPARALRAD
jgi:ABC-type antimicrobial peptide transport system permease subunit